MTQKSQKFKPVTCFFGCKVIVKPDVFFVITDHSWQQKKSQITWMEIFSSNIFYSFYFLLIFVIIFVANFFSCAFCCRKLWESQQKEHTSLPGGGGSTPSPNQRPVSHSHALEQCLGHVWDQVRSTHQSIIRSRQQPYVSLCSPLCTLFVRKLFSVMKENTNEGKSSNRWNMICSRFFFFLSII